LSDEDIAAHYARTELLAAIRDGVAKLGKTPATVTVEDLAPVDEFHVGGREASEAFLDQLSLVPSHRVLDIGCGLGGSARFAATRYGCRVTGIDLTNAFIATGESLCDWVGLGDRVSLREGSALAMPFEADAFDAAYMLHVGMNIADKRQLCAEVHRVLRPGARFGIYDLMRTGGGTLQYPVPWASVPEHSALSTPSDYRSALEAAAFTIGAERRRRAFALEFFASMKARTAAAGGPAPLGLHLLMGHSAATKLTNVVSGIASGMLAPVELVAEKPR
jgi:SAM-dependent methyltransferase